MSDNETIDEQVVDFDLATWCKQYQITRKTEGILRKEELITSQSLSMLDNADLRELGLPIGQRKCVQLAIKELAVPSKEPVVTRVENMAAEQPEDQEPVDIVEDIASIRQQAATLGAAGKEIDSLMKTLVNPVAPGLEATFPAVMPHKAREPANMASYMAHVDPRTLLTVKSGRPKTTHITNFLPEKTKKRIQSRKKGIQLGTDGSDRIVLQADDRHPYSGITLAEWSSANCRLMAHMLQTGELARDNVEYYLAYTTQICEYYELYEWEAILDFDYLYRERQSEHGFLFGYIPPNMEFSLLARPRQKPQRQQPIINKTATGTAREECKLFKARNGNCPYGEKCKFRHTAGGSTAHNPTPQ